MKIVQCIKKIVQCIKQFFKDNQTDSQDNIIEDIVNDKKATDDSSSQLKNDKEYNDQADTTKIGNNGEEYTMTNNENIEVTDKQNLNIIGSTINRYPTLGNEKKSKAEVREIDGRFVVGQVGGTFKQVPYIAKKSSENAFHKTDIIADIANVGELLVCAGSIRGESHFAHMEPRQDYFVVDSCKSASEVVYIIAIIADGVGNSSQADKYAEYMSNYTNLELKDALERGSLEDIKWNDFVSNIWKESVRFCMDRSGMDISGKDKSNSKGENIDIDEFVKDWATTLEFIVVSTNKKNANDFIHVTVAGDGGCYIINNNDEWRVIKEGKVRKGKSISNAVYCLPYEPEDFIVNKGKLNKDEMIFLVTDGFGDFIQADADVREYFSERLHNVKNISEYIRTTNVAVKGMDDDKTGILIKYYNKSVD